MKLARSSALGVLASLVMGGSLLVPFRIGIEVIGAREVGIWALVQSVFIVSRLPEMGVGLNITRALAAERKIGQSADPRPYFWAALLVTILPVFFLGGVLFFATPTFLGQFFRDVVPLSVVTTLCLISLGIALFSAISTVLLSIIEGYGRLDQRHFVMIVSNLALITVAHPLVTKFGVIGLAMTYLASSLLLLILSACVTLPLCFTQGQRIRNVHIIVRELWRSNLQVSAMAVTRMTFEPLTKLVVASSGNLSAVAYVDLALKLTTQARIVIQAAVQPLLAFGARGICDNHDEIIKTFERAQMLVVKSNLLLMSCQFLAAGFVSYIALGEMSALFIMTYIMLVVGNGLNSLGVVGYYYVVSAGKMGEVVSIHVQMMLTNVAAGLLGGWLLGAQAAVAAYAFSFAYGGVALFRIWCRASGERWRQLFGAERWLIMIAALSLSVSIIVFLSQWGANQSLLASVAGLALASVFAVLFLLKNWKTFRGKSA